MPVISADMFVESALVSIHVSSSTGQIKVGIVQPWGLAGLCYVQINLPMSGTSMVTLLQQGEAAAA